MEKRFVKREQEEFKVWEVGKREPEWLGWYNVFYDGEAGMWSYTVEPGDCDQVMYAKYGDRVVMEGKSLVLYENDAFENAFVEIDEEVECPRHYRGNGIITCTQAAESMMNTGVHCIQPQADPEGKARNIPCTVFGWWLFAFKYLWRWPYKGGIKDLKKCIKSIQEMIRTLEEGE